MNYPNVMECEIDWNRTDITDEEIESILEYNLNDVLATYEFYKRSKEKIELRKKIIAKYNIPCINFSDSKIGESLILDLYSNKINVNKYDIKPLRSFHESIYLKDIIFPYIKFESKEFNKLLTFFSNITIKDGTLKKAFEKSVNYKGFQYDYGVGGIHGCIASGIYDVDNDHVIIDCDVASLYPNIAIRNGLYIEHLGRIFTDVYDTDIVQERIKAKRSGEMSISDALKLAANSVYGKSNENTSFLYDPKYTVSTTINGQLVLTMLSEMLVNNIPNLLMLQVNTDGITVKIHKQYIDKYFKLCKEWENITKLELEYVNYSKMIISNVNNYIAIKDNGKIKYKGSFEIDKVVGNEPAYHKDNSFRIIPIALSDYFSKGIPVEDTINCHSNIYDFCGRQKFKRDSHGKIHYIKDGIPVEELQQKNTRYYISKTGATFVKYYDKGDNEAINKGYLVTIFNKYEEKPIKDYNLDYSFYIKECYKIIHSIEKTQLNLF